MRRKQLHNCHSGANNLCDVDYLRRNRARFEESDIVLLQMEIPFESVCYAVELASGLHKTVILNPAPHRTACLMKYMRDWTI